MRYAWEYENLYMILNLSYTIKDFSKNYPGIQKIENMNSYSSDDVAKLQFIRKARQFNFSIDECRELLSLYQDKNRSSKEVKRLTTEKILEIDTKLEELNSLKNQLKHLVSNCQGNDRPDCPILDALSNDSLSV